MMEKYKVSFQENNQRIDKYLRKCLNNTPLSMIYKLFRKKDVKVNGKPVKEDYIIHADDEITVYLPIPKDDFTKPLAVAKVKRQFITVYEDDNILIVSKPTGLLVHEAEGQYYNTLSNQVISYLQEKGEYQPDKTPGFIPGPAHRLDRNTSGLVIFGKNMLSLQELNEAFKNREGLQKYYLTLVEGKISNEGIINCELKKSAKEGKVYVVKSGGQEAITIYRPVEYNEKYTLLEVELKTGRTHQIRVHMAYISHPVIGDKKYGNFQLNSYFEKEYNWENQLLHAYKIVFNGLKGNLSYLNGKAFTDELPKDMQTIIRKIFL